MKMRLLILMGILALLLLESCTKKEYPSTGSIERLSPELDLIIAPGTLPEILAEGFDWSEGPLWLPEQKKVIFSDIPNNSIFEWSESQGLKLYLKPSGYTSTLPRGGEAGSNGLLLDGEGQLILCQHGDRRIARMNAPLDASAAAYETIAGSWKGKRFNSPNDAVYSSNGRLYITDPAYGMELGFEDPRRDMDFTGVFLITPDGKVSLQTDRLSAPNGIGLSPDESSIYVANSGGSSGPVWMEYKLAKDGTLQKESLFYDASAASDSLRGAPDGLVVRDDGIIFATGPGGVWVFTPTGKHLGIILTGQATSNCTLDAKNRYLYITADMYLMRIRLR
jgi:gluconolactonase